MAAPSFDMAQAMSSLEQQDDVRRKVELDALRKHLEVGKTDEKKLREACEGFESIFIQQLWKQMRSNVPKEGYLHSKEEDYYLSMFDEEMSKKMASAGGMGLGDMMYDQLKQQLNNASRATSPASIADPLPLKPLARTERPSTAPAAQEAAAGDGPATGGGAKPFAPFEDSLSTLYTPMEQAQAGSAAKSAQKDATATASSSKDTVVQDATTATSLPTAFSASLDERIIPARVDTVVATETEAEVMAQVNDLERRIEMRQGVSAGEGGPVPVERGTVSERMRGELNLKPMEWPVEGDISSDFGWRRDPFTGRHAFHAGVDIVADEGSDVKACWKGEVVFAGERGGYGNLVIVDHGDGWESWYGHNSELDVKVGDVVAAGNKIAEVGSSGRSTGAHLHFELRQGEQAWDPTMIQHRLQSGLPIGNPSRKEG